MSRRALRVGPVVLAAAALLLMVRTASAIPTVSISSPANGSTVSNMNTDSLDVFGSVGGPNLRNWVLDYHESGTWISIATGTTPRTNQMLGTWTVVLLLSAGYPIRLTAWDTSNASATTQVTVTVNNLTVAQNTIQMNAASGQTTTYTTIVPAMGMMGTSVVETLKIKNAVGTVVRDLVTGVTRSPGTYNDVWNGRNNGNAIVPDGPYFYVAEITTDPPFGPPRFINWDLSAKYLNDYSSFTYVDPQTYDPFKGDHLDIDYNFSAGRVTIAVAPPGVEEIQSTCPPPSGFCIVDHKYEEGGSQVMQWAGVDATGKYRPDIGMMAIVTERALFARNAVVVFGTRPTVRNVRTNPLVIRSGSSADIEYDVTASTPVYNLQIRILNQESLTVLRTLGGGGSCTGACRFLWDGKAGNGMLVAPGLYTVTVTVTDTLQNSVSGQGLTIIQY